MCGESGIYINNNVYLCIVKLEKKGIRVMTTLVLLFVVTLALVVCSTLNNNTWSKVFEDYVKGLKTSYCQIVYILTLIVGATLDLLVVFLK